jgi:hypothetical protein
VVLTRIFVSIIPFMCCMCVFNACASVGYHVGLALFVYLLESVVLGSGNGVVESTGYQP